MASAKSRFDPFRWLIALEARKPALARRLAMAFLGRLSPFNGHLSARLEDWTDNQCVIALRKTRGVRNHVGNIHAGALFTLGETCAGLVIIRNFPFGGYRPLMTDVRVSYAKQARGDVTGVCTLSPEALETMRRAMAAGEVPSVEMVTRVTREDGETAATITTIWQVKPWEMVQK